MLAEGSTNVRSGSLDREIHLPATAKLKLLDFIAHELPRWRDHRDRPAAEAETTLTEHLCSHLNSATYWSKAWSHVQFQTETRDEVCAGRKIDLAPKPRAASIVIQGRRHSQFEALFPIECKRLPTPQGTGRDEREYVVTDPGTTGGIQRFKLGYHGAAHAFAAMIAYVQSESVSHWLEMVNGWIRDLASGSDRLWTHSDQLRSEAHDTTMGVCRLASKHRRQGALDDCHLHHLWVEMKEGGQPVDTLAPLDTLAADHNSPMGWKMSDSLSEWFDVYVIPKGRREHAQEKIRSRAIKYGFKELAAHCEKAIQHEQELRDMARVLRSLRNKPTNPRLMELDPKIDSLIGSIFRSCKDKAKNFEGEPQGQAASRILETVYPRGAGEITNLEYIEQDKEVSAVLRLFLGDLSQDIRTLGLDAEIRRLKILSEEFGEILANERTDVVTPDKVRAAEVQGQEYLLQTIALVLGRYYSSSREDVKARNALLAPVDEQEEAVAASHKSRRPVKDVDPKTGKEEREDGNPPDDEEKEPEEKEPEDPDEKEPGDEDVEKPDEGSEEPSEGGGEGREGAE